jgi:glycerophosphoryl diester phosphodiesterase
VQEIAHNQWPLRATSAPIGVLSHRGRTAGTQRTRATGDGGPGEPRENTLAAFAAALAAGADGVELDVRRTADGVAVVHHDAEVPGAGPLHQLERAELPSWVPTLEEALAACAGAAVDVEVKSSPAEPGHDPSERLAAEVAEMLAGCRGGERGPDLAMVSSFWPAALAAVHATGPELVTGLLLLPAVDAEASLDGVERLGARVLLPFRDQVTPQLVEQARGRGLAVVPWGVDEEAELQAAAEDGVDAVVTDYVARALLCLGRA